MGLIKALAGAVGSTFADQWKEFFYCDSIPNDVLVVKGQKRTGKNSSNTKGSDNVISNGSGIAVNEGQCMIIVEQGAIVELCAEPGQYTFDSSTEPSIFSGNLGESVKQTFATIGRRFTMGGDTGKDQRVYYFNTKEITDNKFGTASPILFRIVDPRANLDLDVSIRCNGLYSYRIVDPVLFYQNISGNVIQEYNKSEIDMQLKTEFVNALQPAMAALSELQIRPNAIPAHVEELCEAVNAKLSDKWSEKRGIKVESIALNPITMTEEDTALLKEAQRAAMLSNPGMAAGYMTGATGEAMKSAAANENGAMMGFMGMGMAQQAGGVNAQSLFQMNAQQQAAGQAAPTPTPAPAQATNGDSWTCSCGTTNTGKFCVECGSKKPSAEGWTCSCGAINKGKFCMECGTKKPAGAPLYRCDKCGWEPEDPMNPPKFCMECGDPFNDDDIVQ